jgi:multiple sugar transport system permease protein
VTVPLTPTRSPAADPSSIRRPAHPAASATIPIGAWIFVGPALLIVVALAILPLCYGVWLSLTNWTLLQGPTAHYQGLAAYHRLLSSHQFWAAFVRTLKWTAGTVAIEVIVGLPVALLLNRRTPVTGAVTGLLLLPWVTPFVVLSYAWIYLYDGRFGPFHTALHELHLTGAASPLSDPHRALWAITLISGWKGVPFMAVALLAALKGIPDELYEAAAVDGATASRRFWYVTLPLLGPTLLTMSFVLGVLAFYSFDLVWLTTKGGPGDQSTIIGVQLYETFFTDGRPGYAAAMGTFTLMLFVLGALILGAGLARRRRTT